MTDKPKKRQAPQLPRLTIAQQKALGLDTGPVLIVSTAPVAKRSASPSPSSEPLEMTQITPEELAADKMLPEKPAEESGFEKED